MAEDPGGVILLVALQQSDHGRVYAWQHRVETWDSPGNDASALTPLADGFPAFLRTLFDTDDGWGRDHWAIPVNEANARDLILK